MIIEWVCYAREGSKCSPSQDDCAAIFSSYTEPCHRTCTAHLNCLIVAIVYIFGLLLKLPVLMCRNVFVVALGSYIDFAVLLCLLSCLLTPGTSHYVIYAVTLLAQIEWHICKGC